MFRVYISYRPEDADVTNRIVWRCLQTYGQYSVSINPEDTLPSRTSLEQHVDNLIHQSNAVFIIIGVDWAGLDEYGRYRLSSADIPVAIEVRMALLSHHPTYLVLVKGARLPEPDAVPENLQELLELPVVELPLHAFNAGLNRLVPPPPLHRRLMFYLSMGWARRYAYP